MPNAAQSHDSTASTPATLPPLVKSVEVPCGQTMAFDVFIEQMGSWWPLGMFSVSKMSGVEVKELRVEAKVGGRIVEHSSDGKEHHWGTIKVYDPHDFVSMDFHIVHPDFPPGDFSLVEVRFTAIDEGRTFVELTQTNWETFGEMAEGIRGGYDKGWSMIFEQKYKAACSA